MSHSAASVAWSSLPGSSLRAGAFDASCVGSILRVAVACPDPSGHCAPAPLHAPVLICLLVCFADNQHAHLLAHPLCSRLLCCLDLLLGPCPDPCLHPSARPLPLPSCAPSLFLAHLGQFLIPEPKGHVCLVPLIDPDAAVRTSLTLRASFPSFRGEMNQ